MAKRWSLWALVGGRNSLAWRDGEKTSSPNAGGVEAAFAGALDDQLGGTNRYDGVAKEEPWLGDSGQALDADRLREELSLWVRVNAMTLVAGGLRLALAH